MRSYLYVAEKEWVPPGPAKPSGPKVWSRPLLSQQFCAVACRPIGMTRFSSNV